MYSIFGITKTNFIHKLNKTTKNVLIILNATVLKLDDWIGTLEH